jgi:GT2 family glycosyltransferase
MLFIIIPVFNRWEFTKACLKSLELQNNKLFKIVVVDHGSTDDTHVLITSQFPNVKLLNGDKSMWWTAATNLGIKYALKQNASFILTLNNDTVAEPEYISELFNAIKNGLPNALIGSASIDVITKQVTYTGEVINWFLESSSFNTINVTDWPSHRLIPVTHFPGRGLLIPRAVFEQIGLFDEKYFPHYLADYEFTLRAAKRGFPIFCALNAKIGTYPEESGAVKLKAKKSINGYRHHLFGIKGGGNLPLFYRYAFRYCPIYALPSLLLLGTIRRLIGYWL